MGLLHHPLDAVLGSVSKIKLLRALLPLDRPVSLREAARLAGISPPAAMRPLDDLVKMGILELRTATSQHLYTVNRQHVIVRDGLVPCFTSELERMRAIGEALREALGVDAYFRPTVLSAVVFGSTARGNDQPGSDLDLLVIAETPTDAEQVWQRILDAGPALECQFGIRVSPVVLTLERLRERNVEGDPFVEAVRRESIVVVKPSVDELLGS